MITVLPVDDVQTRRLFATEGLEIPEGARATVASAGSERLGVLLYRREGEKVRLLRLNAEDPGVADGLLRAVLSAEMDRGAGRAEGEDISLLTALDALGFHRKGPGEATRSVLIREIFNKSCRSCSSD